MSEIEQLAKLVREQAEHLLSDPCLPAKERQTLEAGLATWRERQADTAKAKAELEQLEADLVLRVKADPRVPRRWAAELRPKPKRKREPSLRSIIRQAKAEGASAVERDGVKVSLTETAPPEPDAPLDQWLAKQGKRDAH